ncbi:hypothetical protein [Microbacterium paludicola]|uniref:hypothetical protein n=1 Tax=Microbacterium paludicola TaxID=300019 RepID=UPI0011A532C4|nr:hypothetical protein [Microbacterium paludicola]
MATWHDLNSARAEWLGAPKGDETLQNLLDVSRAEILAYAPAVPPAPEASPTNVGFEAEHPYAENGANEGVIVKDGTRFAVVNISVQDDGVWVDEPYIPDSYRWAHLAHARNIWNAQNTNPSGSFGAEEGSFSLTPFPMDWAIKARLRPTVLFGGPVG